jgi:hypothetical protein
VAKKPNISHFLDTQAHTSLATPTNDHVGKLRLCTLCKQLRAEGEYYSSTGHYRYARCVSCRFQTGRERRCRIPAAVKRRYTAEHYRRNKDKIKVRIARNRIADPMAYAIRNSLGLKRRAGEKVSVSWTHIKKILESQGYKCAVTQLPFWGSGRPQGIANWDSPSLDRIEPDGPYSADNLRVVLFCINAFRGRMADDQMLKVAQALVAPTGRIRVAGVTGSSPRWEQFGLLSGM